MGIPRVYSSGVYAFHGVSLGCTTVVYMPLFPTVYPGVYIRLPTIPERCTRVCMYPYHTREVYLVCISVFNLPERCTRVYTVCNLPEKCTRVYISHNPKGVPGC